jgi:hypothetical protein
MSQTIPIQQPTSASSNAFVSFLNSLQMYVDAHMAKHFPKCQRKIFSFKDGRRYIKVIAEGSVYCFIDKGTGDVLKPASWNAPAKHARSNIHNSHNGLDCCGPYGIASLR